MNNSPKLLKDLSTENIQPTYKTIESEAVSKGLQPDSQKCQHPRGVSVTRVRQPKWLGTKVSAFSSSLQNSNGCDLCVSHICCHFALYPHPEMKAEKWASPEPDNPVASRGTPSSLPLAPPILPHGAQTVCNFAPRTHGYSTNVFRFLSSVPGARWHSLRFIIIVFHNLRNVSPLKASAPCWFPKLTLT